MRIFLTGLALNFDADFFELEEIAKRALFQIGNAKQGVS